ncbi:hypothetical protein HU200_065896 [Digitaria exilis]|uniref:Ureide permease n=1 Tax=Digitaria exilis TaxID=1010633 RepID=A0A835A328_9POAL|nr:hypothetical protein HU200_065896 [Digitaria exilis]
MDRAVACASSSSLLTCDELREVVINKAASLKMFVIESKAGAIAVMLASLLLLGTWPALLTLLERRGRLPQHTYLDYSLTNFLAAVFIALTLGQLGGTDPSFITQLSQDNWPSVLFAMAGGVALSVGNLSTQYAWAYVGLSVTEVISCSMVVVIGTTVNYFLDSRINRAEILFPGVACFLVAVILGSADLENGDPDTKDATKAEAGTAEYLIKLEQQRSIKVFRSSTFFGLGIVFFSGVCLSLFSPLFNLATNDQWRALPAGVPHLVVYTAFFYFSISCFVFNIGLNMVLLYRPMAGVPKSSFRAYLHDWNGRQWALLAGLLAAGYAAADAVQARLVASFTFWGVVLFGEYRKSSRRTYILLGFMLFMFVAAVAVLMASSGHRGSQ